MTEVECTKVLTYLGTAFGKEFDQSEAEQYYDFLNEYSYDTFKRAVKNIIKRSKFLPKISEIIEECDNCKETAKIDVIEFMHQNGYFKAVSEYAKAVQFVQRGIVPKWLQEDINKYYKMMKQKALEAPERLMIGGK